MKTEYDYSRVLQGEILELEQRLFQKKIELEKMRSSNEENDFLIADKKTVNAYKKVEAMKGILQKEVLKLMLTSHPPRFMEIDSVKRFCESMIHPEGLLVDILKDTSLILVILDENDKIISCNDAFVQLIQKDKNELIRQSLMSVAPLQTSDSLGLSFQKLNEWKGKVEMKTSSGGNIGLFIQFICFPNLKEQSITKVILGERTDTSSLNLQNELNLQSLLKDFVEYSNDLILFFDAQGNILFSNDTFRRVMGFSKKELEERPLFNLISSEYKGKIAALLQQTIEKRTDVDFSITLVNKNQKKIHLNGKLALQQDDEGNTIFRASFVDITKQKQVEKAQELYYEIAKLVEKDIPLSDLYHKFYLYLQKAIGIDSFLILIQSDDNEIEIPFYINSDFGPNEPIQGEAIARDALSLNRAMFMYNDILGIVVKQREIPVAYTSFLPKVWMCTPLILDGKSKGVMIVQSYVEKKVHDKKDLELLNFVSGQLASAIVRFRNENQINAQKARLEAIFESGTQVMWTINKDASLNRYNQNFSNKLEDFFSSRPEYQMNLFTFLKKYKQLNKREWINRYEKSFKGINQQFEVKFIGQAGDENWWDITLSPIADGQGKIIEVSGIAHDITQKKITEIGLAESEEKFRNIFDALLDVYFRINMDGIITMVSPSVFELMGLSQLEIIGQHISKFYLNKRGLTNAIRRLIKNGFVKNFESRIFATDGNPHNIISNFRLLYDADGNPSHIEGVARDITELKNKTEELRAAKNLAERSLEVKKRFLSNMSHEIRTPMNGIIGMIDLINESVLNAEQKNYISTIKKSSETLLNILNDILDLSKIEAGKMQLRSNPASLHQIIEKLYALFQQNAHVRNTELYIDIDNAIPKAVLVDETRLLQILSNLTSNAIKFTENGVVTIRCKHKENIANNYHEILFEVEDTGIGIAKNDVRDLFKQFSQVNSTYTKSFGGTGLGLAISKELCHMMGGKIGVSSNLGEGSLFWFTVKLKECNTQLLVEQDTVAIQSFNGKANIPKIMIVDDNEVNRIVANTILQKVGCEVTIISNGLDAIKEIKHRSYDLIFMDIQMPEMNGITATEKIHALNLENTPPIIAMTAFSMKEEREEFLKAGMDDYVAKPIKANVLIGKVNQWYNKKEAKEIVYAQERNKRDLNHLASKSDAKNDIDSLFIQHEGIITMQVVRELEGFGGKELIRMSYQEFDENGEQFINTIEEAYQNKDTETLLNAAHSLKGESGTLGVDKIFRLAKRLEAEARNGHNISKQGIEELAAAYLEFKTHYKEILNL